ncbi:MAG: hypothetical protein ACI4MT_05990 [Christensenellales bacterium]
MIKYIHKIKHISKWESKNKRAFDEFLFSKIRLLFCPKILMVGINPSAKQNEFCDSTNLKLINALLRFNEISPKKYKGYRLTNFSSKVTSQWENLSVDEYDFELKLLEKWLETNRPICLFYGPHFINSSTKDIKNTIFTNKFRSLIEEYRENIFITTYNGKFAHPSHNPTVEIEKYNPNLHILYPTN